VSRWAVAEADALRGKTPITTYGVNDGPGNVPHVVAPGWASGNEVTFAPAGAETDPPREGGRPDRGSTTSRRGPVRVLGPWIGRQMTRKWSGCVPGWGALRRRRKPVALENPPSQSQSVPEVDKKNRIFSNNCRGAPRTVPPRAHVSHRRPHGRFHLWRNGSPPKHKGRWLTSQRYRSDSGISVAVPSALDRDPRSPPRPRQFGDLLPSPEPPCQ